MDNSTVASLKDSYPLIAITAIGFSVIMLTAFHKTKNNKAESKDVKSKEQLAKASFRVRKSNLMTIAGHGKRCKKKKKQARLNRDELIAGAACDEATSSWYGWFKSLLIQLMARFMSLVSFGYFQPIEAIDTPTKSVVQDTQRSKSKRSNLDGYYDQVTVVGVDCEMVGGGRNGMKSLLARCSVVTLDHIPVQATGDDKENLTSLTQNLVVLYDKFIIPKEKVTDYRTEWSGITKNTYSNQNKSSIPIVSFQQCQNEITQLFASISNKKVVVVGHALENDFEALEMTHPISLVRDTAFYVPYMRQVRTKLYSRKLSVLSSEELGIDIQQQQQQQQSLDTPPPLEDEGGDVSMIQNDNNIGHSSVEDAAAALRLYWNRCVEWERSLGYPLSSDGKASSSTLAPLSMHLDGCNLPMAMRGIDFKVLYANPPQDGRGDDVVYRNADMNIHCLKQPTDVTDEPKSFSITSRKRDNGNVHTIDWMPVFLSALSPSATPKLDIVTILWDGAKYRDILKSGSGKRKNQRRAFCSDVSSSIITEITRDGNTVDDLLFERLWHPNGAEEVATSRVHRQIISLNKTIRILSFDATTATAEDSLSHYVVVRRKGGGSKTHRKLFDKLNLRRPNEGALCLTGLTNKLQRHSWKLAKELQREKGIEKVIECELRSRQELKDLVVTDDVYLTERLMRCSNVVVLSFMQFSNMF